MWNYSGGVEPLRAAIEYGPSLIDTAEAYGTEEIVGKAIKEGCRLHPDLETSEPRIPRVFFAESLKPPPKAKLKLL